jgi:hypothetical protein
VPFQKLPEIVNRFLTAPDPILLHYTINPTLVPPDRPSAWDVEIKTEDVPLKSRITVMLQSSKESAQDLSKLDEEVSPMSKHTLQRLNLPRVHTDRPPRTVAAQRAPQAYVPAVFCTGPCALHSHVARVTVS